jgi:hypothetical protein
VVFGFEVPKRACHQYVRNFKSTTLGPGKREKFFIFKLGAWRAMLDEDEYDVYAVALQNDLG